MRKFVGLFALLAIGCANNSPGAKSPLSLTGPGGTVSLGDSLEQAKKAFPPPAGAHEFQSPLSFAIISKTGWAWGLDSTNEAFEVATKDGKIISIARVSGEVKGHSDEAVAQLGEPTRKALGTSVDEFVWEVGNQARILMQLKKANAFLPAGSMTLIGSKDDLGVLSYRADDPSINVRQMDAAADQLSSPAMKKLMEDAKSKALQNNKK